MSAVDVSAEGFVVDATLLADAFNLPASKIRAQMNDGGITSLSEKGEGEDAGRWRLTFYCGARALRLTVDEKGTILGKATFPVQNRGA